MHAFKHAVAGSNYCATCGYQRGHLNHIGHTFEDITPDGADSALSTVLQVGAELVADIAQWGSDSPLSVDPDPFNGAGGGFGGGGSSDGW